MTDSANTRSLSRAWRGVGSGGRKNRRGSTPRRRAPGAVLTLLLFALPSVLLMVLLTVYPLLYAGSQSLHNGSLLGTGDFVGAGSYQSVLSDPRFWAAARFTVLFTLAGVFGSWVVGIGLALLLRLDVPARGTFKVLLLLPWVVPIVVSATAWNYLVATPQSPLPLMAHVLGFGAPQFLADPTLAIITVCIFKVWISFPFMMLMSSAALTGIDQSVYEAAGIDGATSWQVLTMITLPMIARTTYISWILMAIFCVNDFPTIFLLTGGGPLSATTSLVILAYNTVFYESRTGPGVAIAFVMTLVLIVISILLYRRIKKVEVE